MDAQPAEPGNVELAVDEGFIKSQDGLRLFRRSVAPRDALAIRAHVVVVHGYGEHCGRYRETMERLARAGHAAHAFDLRGHGQSDGVRAHVDRFAEYLGDLDVMASLVTGKAQGKKTFLLGHSLGGLIVARWLLGKKDGFAGAVLSSPFLALAFEPPKVKLLAAKVLDLVAPRLHLGNELKYEQLTSDVAIQKATAQDPLYQRVTTSRWFSETTAAQRDTLARAAELTVPCLVLLGEADPIALPEAGRRLFAGLGAPDKTVKGYEGFRHEVLNEALRERVFADLLSWLEKHL